MALKYEHLTFKYKYKYLKFVLTYNSVTSTKYYIFGVYDVYLLRNSQTTISVEKM